MAIQTSVFRMRNQFAQFKIQTSLVSQLSKCLYKYKKSLTMILKKYINISNIVTSIYFVL